MTGFRTLFLGLAFALALPVVRATPPADIDLDLVSVRPGLEAMRHEVSIGLWQACVKDGECSHTPVAGPGAVGDNYPVTGIGIYDAIEFTGWAQRHLDPALRLPTLEEWQAFSDMPLRQSQKIFTDPRLAWAATYGSEGTVDPTLRAGGGFGGNRFGVDDVKGNVWEWTSSCVTATSTAACPAYFAAGEHAAKVPVFVRDPAAGGCAMGTPPAHLGLRLVRAP